MNRMILFDLALAAGVLGFTVMLGTLAHELSHAAVLRVFDIPHDLYLLPDRETDSTITGSGRLAAVVPREIPGEVSPWGLRVAALAPLTLATPMVLLLLGVLPDPTATGNLPISAAAIGWFACAIPSPTDFSLVWYAGTVIGAEHPLPSGDGG